MEREYDGISPEDSDPYESWGSFLLGFRERAGFILYGTQHSAPHTDYDSKLRGNAVYYEECVHSRRMNNLS